MLAGNHIWRAGAVAAALMAGLAPASASLETDLLNRWYSLLEHANAPALGGLMARNARVQLVDLGVTQTKQEFLDSMAEFAQAIKDGSIRYRIEKSSANAAVALVCYHFTSNDMLARERFTFRSGLVTSSVQETVAENCDSMPK